MSFNNSEVMHRLAKEYISKVKFCDECFCEYWCITNGVKESREPYRGCEHNLIRKLAEEFSDVN